MGYGKYAKLLFPLSRVSRSNRRATHALVKSCTTNTEREGFVPRNTRNTRTGMEEELRKEESRNIGNTRPAIPFSVFRVFRGQHGYGLAGRGGEESVLDPKPKNEFYRWQVSLKIYQTCFGKPINS